MHSGKLNNRESTLNTTNVNSSITSNDCSNKRKNKKRTILTVSLPKIDLISSRIHDKRTLSPEKKNKNSNFYLTEMSEQKKVNLPSSQDKKYNIFYTEENEGKSNNNLISIILKNKNKKNIILPHDTTDPNINESLNVQGRSFWKLNKKYTTFDYLQKTREILRLRYSFNLKKETKEYYEKNIKEELKGLEETMTSLEKYKDELNNHVYFKLNNYLRKLNNSIDKEKDVLYSILKEKSEKIKEKNLIERNILKKLGEKEKFEKWIALELMVKNKKKPNNIEEELKKFPNGIIFNDVEEFDDIIKENEKNIIRLMSNYQEVKDEIDELKKTIEEPLKEQKRKELEKKQLEYIAEKKLEKLKKENIILQKKKMEAIEFTIEKDIKKKKRKKAISSLNFNDVKYANFQKLNMKHKNPLYFFIHLTYNSIKANLAQSIDKLSVKLGKFRTKLEILAMLTSIERGYLFLQEKYNYYQKNSNIYGEKLKKVQHDIDMNKRKKNSEELYQLELQKVKELNEGIEKRDRLVIKQFRKIDRYPFELYYNKKSVSTEKTPLIKELELSDFLYDV